MNAPETLEDARKIRYGKSAANPSGTPYQEGYCVESVAYRDGRIGFHQCWRKIADGIWCRQHHPSAVKARADAAHARFRRHMDDRPAVRAARYREALEKIANRLAETPAKDVKYMREVAREALGKGGTR